MSKKTAFYDLHVTANAKIVDFAGFSMPIQYPKGILHEHTCVRERVGVFDVSHMGEFYVKGPDALAFLQHVTINDVSKLEPDKAQYSAMCYDNGGIIDDMLVYMQAPNDYLVVVNASNIDKDFSWMKDHVGDYDVTLSNVSDALSLLAIQGPKSLETLQHLTDVKLDDIPYYHFTKGKLAGVDMLISRTGYTGETGFEIYFDSNEKTGTSVWNIIMESGEEFGIESIGLGARDTLRLEMGYCLYGHDIDDTTNPLEAGLGWITKIDKGDFIGRNAIVKTKTEGVTRKLVGLAANGKSFPRQGYEITDGTRTIGSVRSGTFSPTLQKPIALAYVAKEFSKEGTNIHIKIRNLEIPFTVTKIPFVKK